MSNPLVNRTSGPAAQKKASEAIETLARVGGKVAGRIREIDWAKHPLGTPDTWPQSLRTMVRVVLSSRFQMWMGWGPDLFIFYNDAYAPTLGLKEPRAFGLAFKQLWPEVYEDLKVRINAVIQTGQATWDEGLLLFLERNGYSEETYHTFSYSPVPDDDGKVGGLFCSVTEVTVRVIGERRMGLLSGLAPKLVQIKEISGVFSAVESEIAARPQDLPFALFYLFDENETEARLAGAVGVNQNDPIAPAVLKLDSDDAPIWPAKAMLVLTTPLVTGSLASRFARLPVGPWSIPPREAVLISIVPQGLTRPAGFMVVGLNPFRPFDGPYRSFLELLAGQIAAGIASARAYEAERKRIEAQSKLDHAKTAFFGNVSHELRTPLTLMLGPLEEIVQQPSPEYRELAAVAHRNGLRLLNLVNTLLDFSRIEAGRMQARYVPTDLAAFTADVASTFRSTMERSGLVFTVHTPPLSRLAYVDRSLWEKVVLNLLSNAYKFTLHGEIRLVVREEKDEVCMDVSDTGIGVPAEAKVRLFERFYRVEGACGRTQEGTGIGLALVHDLVQLHGGSVSVDSALDQGSTFTVRIPLGYQHLPRDRVVEQTEEKAHGHLDRALIEEVFHWTSDEVLAERTNLPRGSAPSFRPNRAKVLLADDNPDMRDYVRRLLVEHFDVTVVPDGEAALEALALERPDLILSDVMMPKLDGFGLIKAVRAHAQWQTLPIILLSARAGEEARVEGFAGGADDYLIKPFSARELIARVTTHIQLARVRKDATSQVKQSEERLRLAVEAAGVGTWSWEIGSDRVQLSEIARRICGLGTEGFAGQLDQFLALVHPDDQALAVKDALSAVQRGIDYHSEVRVLRADGEVRWVSNQGKIYSDEEGKPVRMLGALVDITERKMADGERTTLLEEEQRAREEAEALGATARSLGEDLDLQSTVQKATDAATRLTHAQFGAFFYNVINERQEAYVLYTLSGAPREAFEKFGIPRNTAVFAPTFRGEGVVRLDDVTADPRYGKSAPHFGMPKGHLPVRSYLAVPVKSRDGEVVGGLFFGHPDPGVFTARAERIAVGIAAQAAIAIDNAKLYQRVQNTADRLNYSLSSLDLGDWTWDAASDSVILSVRSEEIYGIKVNTGTTRENLRSVIHAEDRDRVRLAALKAFEQGTDYDVEYRVNHPTRGLRWVGVRGRPVFDGKRKVTGMMGVILDITARKQAELHLRRQRDVLEQVVAGTPLPQILEMLTQWVEQFANRKVIATLLLLDSDGRRLHSAAGGNCPEEWRRYVDGVEIGPSVGSCGTAAYTKNPVITSDIATDEMWKLYKDEALRHGFRACWSTPIQSSNGDILGTFAVYYLEPTTPTADEKEIVDVITRTAAIAIERKQSEKALSESRTRLEQHAHLLESTVAERTAKLRETIGELEAFSYSVSHDMRAPLRSMQGYADLILKEHGSALDPEALGYLKRITKNAERLELLVRDVLAYSKVAKQDIELRPVDLDTFVPPLVAQITESQRPNVKVTIARPLPKVFAHEAYLSQIFSNLIGNAVKFARLGVPPEIEIQCEMSEGLVKVFIRDNGIGIDPAHYDRIFEIFGRIYPDKKYEGTGIGLSIVKKAVQRMGGTIGIDSTLGRGSCFWFTLRTP